jgi:RNA polymerase sigma factor (sigma-70 family)
VGVNPEAVLGKLDGLRALARSLVHGDADADDLLQDTAVAALEHPPADLAGRPVIGWLKAVLRNRWRMDQRSSARRLAREHAVAIAAEDRDDRSTDPIDRARALARLASALVALDEPFRTAVIRRYLDGRTAAEIARELEVPAATVRWRLMTGLARLRAALDDSAPRWQLAFAPLAPLAGVTVKTKTSIALVLVVILLLAVIGVVWFARDRAVPGPAEVARAPAAPTLPVAPASRATDVAVPPLPDPLPGQGRAVVEASDPTGGAIGGRVINWSTGDGVAGAELTFTSDAGAVTIRSRDGGAFELAPGAPGRYVLSTIAAPGFLPYAPELLHSTVHVTVARGQTVRGITVFLFPALDYQGTVVDARGAPVPGARVRLLGTPTGEQAIDKLQTEWTSDRDGRFTFHAADDAVLEATRGTQRGWARLDGGVAITRQLKIAIGSAPARDATIEGRAVDASGAPLADVLVRAEPVSRGPDTRSTAFAVTGPDGAFTLTGLDREPYDLAAHVEDHAPATLANIAGGARGVTLTLDGGLPLGGKVVDGAGAPVPAYTLLVFRRDGAAREIAVARSIVDPRGRFSVRVPAGDYELIASASGWAPSAATAASAGATGIELALSAGATLRGIVVTGHDGTPLSYARVMREARGGGASAQPANAGTVTRTDGTFELTGIPPGPLSITVAAGGYHPKIEASMTAADGAILGPITIALTKLAEGEQPMTEMVGIGVQLSPDGDALRVDRVIPEGGAERAGIVAGDLVIAIDGAPVAPLGVQGAVAKIRGVAGTTVAVTLRRGDKPVQLVVERRKMRA